ncbi:MAG: hypothetical protein IKQ12_04880 [Prevotella sp.]|nr:hypothetical protein [Prevotella sp.]
MRTMKLWRLAIIMLAAFSLVSCSNDDDDKLNINLLAGKWKRVYDEGVVSEGYVYYIFTPGETPDRGDCDILSSDVFGGDFFNERAYMLTENGHRLCIFKKTFGGNPEAQYYDILRLTGNHLTLRITDSDILLNFEKTK